MFADLSGFTALSERLDPEAATELVNRCFTVLEYVVDAHGGVVDKYVGDCIVAVWDLPHAAAGARRAAAAACAIRAAIDAFTRTVALPSPLAVHIGIGTGPVIAGVMGGERSGAFTVVGATVALAQVIGELAAPGQIFTDAETRARAGDGFAWSDLGELALTPLPGTVHGYELGSPRDDSALAPVVAAALARGAAPPDAGHPAARSARRGSERRQVTVVFAEVAGLDALVHVLAPEVFTQLVNRCFAALEPAVHGHGGVVDKYIGATVMALFGAPTAIEEAPKQALNAAIEMRNRLRQFGEEQGLAGLHLYVGVNSGLVIAGDMGGPRTRDFTVIGDAVNVAARLKAAAQADHAICVGRDTHRHTVEAFEFAALPPLALKGKQQPVPVWHLLSDHERPHRTAVAATGGGRAITSALVGRADELAAVERAVRRVSQGLGGIVTVVGDAGLGKSRLIAELLARPLPAQVRLLEGRSLSTGQGLSYHPFVDLLRHWAGISEDDAPRDAAARLARAVRELMPDEFDDILPLIARLMGVRLGEAHHARLREIDGDALEALMFKSVREWLERLSNRQPLVLLFEDLHWADQSSIKLLEAVLRLVESQPLLIVAVGRPSSSDTLGRIQAAARNAHATRLVELSLRRLNDEQAGALIDNLLKTDQLPYAMRALVTRTAEGNPFFIEEVIRSFIDGGAVQYRDGRFHVTEKIEAIEVPGTIGEVIMARVDRLDEHARHVLQVAAVIGRSFYDRVLRAVLGNRVELDAALDQLTRTQLVSAHESHGTAAVRRRLLHGELEYVFTHALAQEAVYGSLLQRTRRELHRQVATAIEELFADRLVDAYAMLAYHFSRAEELEKAEDYLFKAGEEAARSAAANEALSFFRDASRAYLKIHGQGGDPRRKAMLERNIAQALLNTGALTESIDHFDGALEYLGERLPQGAAAVYVRFAADLLAVLARLYLPGRRRRRHVSDSERQVFEVMFLRARALTTSDPRRLFFDNIGGARRLNRVDPTQVDGACGLYAGISALFAFTGFSFGVSARFLALARPLIRPGNRRDEFVYRNFWFIHHYLQGHWEDEHVVDEALVDEALSAGQLWDVNTYVGLLSDARLRQGRFAAARDLIDWLAEISDSYGFAFAATNRDAMTMLLLLEERRLPEALDAAERYQRARHEDLLRVLGLGSKAKAEVLLGDLAGAASTLAAAERITRRSRDLPAWHLSALAAARLRFDVAMLERAQGAIPAPLRRTARRSAGHAVRIAAKAAIQRPEIYQLCGRACWLLGSRRQALIWWARSLAIGARMGAQPEVARTRVVLARSLAAGTRVDGLGAAEHLRAARAELAALGLAWDGDQLAAASPAHAA